ncbi:hypothetical protein [Aliiglaciecola sp. LCG003]|uniref:magnesium transporter MgtE N-terminal domain-containing protein n=1 Tax=Aliiglaciecola sp. LCG003 TaxID=3053655 RepID=UPI002573DA3B|nr:hypothetical protein [Aliiglaciecola sp. LCG003]WJG09111.1 hypothetical protein QR722_17555 [Aliiglaciecola sp. LCG003]
MNQVHYNLTLHFIASEPIAAARKLELVDPEHAAAILKSAPISPAVKVLKSMIPSVSAKLFSFFTEAQCLKLTEYMDIADLAAILRHVDADTRQSAIKLLPLRKQTLCKMLITYPEYTIGSMVETDVLIVDNHMEIAEVMFRLKKRSYSYLQSLYVVNQARQFEGKVFIGDLLRGDSNSEVTSLIISSQQEVCNANSDMIAAMEWDLWNHTDTLAVVNKKHEFVGVIHYSRLRHFMSIRHAHESKNGSVSSDLLEIYGDTIVNMVDLIQPLDTNN